MKQISYIFTAFLVLCFALSGQALAQDEAAADDSRLISIHEARTLENKTPVATQGYIVKGLGSHKYMLEDESGSIRVKIEKDVWEGKPTGETDLITVEGTIFRKGNTVEIEVSKVIRN